MEKMNDLLDLLKHHFQDLFSAEEQIIEALPAMIKKANNPGLVSALKNHLQVTKAQRNRLQQVQKLIAQDGDSAIELGENKGGFFSRFFGSSPEKCKAMEGLIKEGEKLMGEDMSPEVMDSAIIGSAHKIEHYEISGYGTARAFANELRMEEVEKLLKQTLDEEYMADDSLTKLAVGKVNLLAENGSSPVMPGITPPGRNKGGSGSKKLATAVKNNSKSKSKVTPEKEVKKARKAVSIKTTPKSIIKKNVSSKSSKRKTSSSKPKS